MIVDGGGLIASAFRAFGDAALPVYVFARGVARSDVVDENEYRRERLLLAEALDRAAASELRLVYFVGAPIYGDFASTTEDPPVQPHSRYGLHQAQCEEIVRARGASHLILRLPNIVGPGGNRHQLVPALVDQVLAGHVRVQTGARRDLLDVEDLVRSTACLARSVPDAVVTNVASGVDVAVSALVEKIMALVGRSAEVAVMPGGRVQRFNIERLKAYGCAPTAGPGYWEAVLERYVPGLVLASGVDPTAAQARSARAASP